MTVSHIIAIAFYIFLVAVVVTIGIWAAPIPFVSIVGWTFLLVWLGVMSWWHMSAKHKDNRRLQKAEAETRGEEAAVFGLRLDAFPELFKKAMIDCGPVVTQGPVRLTFKNSSACYHSARRYLDDGHIERARAEYDSAVRYLHLGQKYAAEMTVSHYTNRM
jgi:hypothetical protein